jgi:hypothetical protein
LIDEAVKAANNCAVLSLNAISRLCGVSAESILLRLEAGLTADLSVDRHLYWRRQDRESLAQLAREAGSSSLHIVSSRLKSGVPLEEALIALPKKTRGAGRFHTSRSIPGCMCDGCEFVRGRREHARTAYMLKGLKKKQYNRESAARHRAKKRSAVAGLKSKKEVLNHLIDEWEKMQ